jgi:hypothetical protein
VTPVEPIEFVVDGFELVPLDLTLMAVAVEEGIKDSEVI